MAFVNRLHLVQGYLSPSRDFSVGAMELLTKGVFKKTCTQIGPRYVRSIEDHGDFEKVWLQGVTHPLFWPKALGRFDLYKACTDCLHEADWHHYEVPETRVEAGDVVLDCGAAEGIFALSVLDRAKHVVIFEPWDGFKQSLDLTFSPTGKASVVSAGLGAQEGTAFLAGESLYGVVSQDGGIPISITTIDAWRSGSGLPVNYIKGDLEGSEFDVLSGAKETILECKPKIAITVYHPQNQWQAMWKLLKSLVPSYKYRIKGLSYNEAYPRPVMLHVW